MRYNSPVSSARLLYFQRKEGINVKEFYTIADVVKITGLSDRTIRTYISQNTLKGEKANGVWQFTVEQLCDFMNDPNVLPGIRAKKNALVYDFLLQNRRSEPEMCLMVDLPGRDSQAVSSFFCEAINDGGYESIRFSFDSLGGQTPRVILTGKPQDVLELIQRFYAAE